MVCDASNDLTHNQINILTATNIPQLLRSLVNIKRKRCANHEYDLVEKVAKPFCYGRNTFDTDLPIILHFVFPIRLDCQQP